MIVVVASAIAYIAVHFQPTTLVTVAGGAFQVTLATDDVSRQQGLTKTQNLAPNGGLLLIFPTDNEWTVPMDNVTFPIDILWLNDDKVIVSIVKNAQPSDETDKSFTPSSAARYVLEVPAGSVANDGIRTGMTAAFTVDESKVK